MVTTAPDTASVPKVPVRSPVLRRLRSPAPPVVTEVTASLRARVVRIDGNATDSDAIAAAYRAEREMLVRTRLELSIALWFLFVGAVTLIERFYFPSRASTMTAHYLTDGIIVVATVVLGRMGIQSLPPSRLATILMSFLSIRATTYLVTVGETVELLAMAHVTLLCALMVVIPWGWVCQLIVVMAALSSFTLAIPHLHLSTVWFYALGPLASTAVTTVLGAYLLDRFRHDHFVRDLEQTERAETAATLVDVGEVLTTHLDQPDLLERASQIALGTLRSDWTGTWICDDEHRTLALRAAVGLREDLREELGALVLPWSYRVMLDDVPADAIVEMPSSTEQSLLSSDLLRRYDIASALLVPLRDDGELLGFQLYAYGHRTGRFTGQQRCLAFGIAHRTTVAMKNARVISELQALSRIKSDFLSTMSHELRTPMNVVAGFTELLAEGAFGALMPAQQETIGRVHRKVTEMLELVGSTLDVGKLDSGRETIAAEAVDLDKLFAELDVELESLASSSVMLRWRRDLGRPTIWTDRAKLKIILKNLVGNALKFTPSGSIDVTAHRADGILHITVRDTGIGIATADIAVIFEKFRQVGGVARSRHGGVGLGLYIVKRLVDLLHGTITVESTLGVGSTFTVEIPLLEPA